MEMDGEYMKPLNLYAIEITVIIRIVSRKMKNVEFCGKTSKFLPKRCLFIFCIKKRKIFTS